MSCIFNYILSSPSGYRPRCTICHPNEKKFTLIACCLFILTIWTRVTDSSVLITTTRAWKTKVSSYYFSDQSQVDMSQKLLFLIYSWFSPTWLLPWRRLLSAMLVPKQTCSIERSQWERKLKSVLCVALCCGSRSDWDKLIGFYRIP